MFVTRANL